MELTLTHELHKDAINELAKRIKNTKWETKVFLCGEFVRKTLLNDLTYIIDICVESIHYDEFAEWICKEMGCYKINKNPLLLPHSGTAYFKMSELPHVKNILFRCYKTQIGFHTAKSVIGEKTMFAMKTEAAYDQDVTMDALYVDPVTLNIIDPTGYGLQDLENNVIRSLRETKAWKEDKKYILRLVQLATKLQAKIDKKTWMQIIKYVNNVAEIPHKDVTEIISAFIVMDNPSYGFKMLRHCGALNLIYPHLFKMIDCKQGESHFGDVFDHTMAVLDNTEPDNLTRWAALFHDVGKPMVKHMINGKPTFLNHDTIGSVFARSYLEGIGFKAEEAEQIAIMIKEHMRFKKSGKGLPSNKSIKKFMSSFEKELMAKMLDLMHADNMGHAEHARRENQIPYVAEKILEFIEEEERKKNEGPTIPINGKDIMEWCKVPSGPKVGKLMKEAQKIFDAEPTLTKNELLLKLVDHVN